MIKLRPYQQKAVQNIQNAFLKGLKHLILQLGTGGGKTIIFTHIAKKTAEKNNKILILTDRSELLFQAGGACKKNGLDAFYIQAGCNVVNSNFMVYVAMSQTFRRRIEIDYWKEFLSGISLIIIDECHKQEFNYLFESGLVDDKHIIGFTATPKRSGRMRQMALDYEEIIETVSVKELIEMGYLVNDDYYGMESPSMSGVAYNPMTGDYQDKAMFERFNSTKLYKGVVNNYAKLTPNTKTLVFCVNIEHSIKTTIEFVNAGYSAKFLVTNVSKPKQNENPTEAQKERYNDRHRVYELYSSNFDNLSGKRNDVISDFSNNQFDILVNAGILITGFDCPDIETIILNRATVSQTLLLQMLGRGSRIYPNKTHFNILDFGANCERLGYYNENRLWSLWHEKVEGEGLPPVKDCGIDSKGRPVTSSNNKPGCRRMILASYKICPFCGFKYPDKKASSIVLNLMIGPEGKQIIAAKNKSFRNMSFAELHDYYKFKKYKSPWLWRQLWYRGKEIEIMEFGATYNWDKKTINTAINYCSTHIK